MGACKETLAGWCFDRRGFQHVKRNNGLLNLEHVLQISKF